MMSFQPSDLIYQESHQHLPSHLHTLKGSVSFSGTERCDEDVHNNINGGEDELSDDGYSQVGAGGVGEKKRRLNLEQVKALEKSFELGNKLEPERKLQLAKALGLQPRQIAIWFQNRRARWKTKQLERDYDLLKKQFDAVKADNENLQAQNKELHAQLLALRSREPTGATEISLKKEAEESWSYGTDGNSDNIDMSRTSAAAAANSMVSSQFNDHKQLFPSFLRPASMTQLLQGTPANEVVQCSKMDQMVRDDGLICNMLGSTEDRPGLWSWPEQNYFN